MIASPLCHFKPYNFNEVLQKTTVLTMENDILGPFPQEDDMENILQKTNVGTETSAAETGILYGTIPFSVKTTFVHCCMQLGLGVTVKKLPHLSNAQKQRPCISQLAIVKTCQAEGLKLNRDNNLKLNWKMSSHHARIGTSFLYTLSVITIPSGC